VLDGSKLNAAFRRAEAGSWVADGVFANVRHESKRPLKKLNMLLWQCVDLGLQWL